MIIKNTKYFYREGSKGELGSFSVHDRMILCVSLQYPKSEHVFSENVNINQEDFLLVFQGSGIEVMEDNLTSAEEINKQHTDSFFLALSFLLFFINSVGFVTLVRMSEINEKTIHVDNSISQYAFCARPIRQAI